MKIKKNDTNQSLPHYLTILLFVEKIKVFLIREVAFLGPQRRGEIFSR